MSKPTIKILPVEPKKMIAVLVNSGMSQEEIAKKAKCSQSLISRLSTGFRDDCLYSIVVRLFKAVESLK